MKLAVPLLAAALVSACGENWEPAVIESASPGTMIYAPTHVARNQLFTVTFTTGGGCNDSLRADVTTATEEKAVIELLIANEDCDTDALLPLRADARLSFATPGDKLLVFRGVRLTSQGTEPVEVERSVQVN